MSEDPSLRVLGPGQARFLLRLAGRVIPETSAADPAVRDRLVAIVDHTLGRQPRSQQFQFKLLLFALRWMTLPFTLHPLDRLPPGWQDRILRLLESAPLTLLRVGIWGLKTLLFMGYYGQETVIAGIGYAPSKTDGNAILHRLGTGR